MPSSTPLWFVILMAILTAIITISAVGILVTNNKVKKGAGYTPPASKGGGTCSPVAST